MKCIVFVFTLAVSASVFAIAPCSGNPERPLSPNEAKGYLKQCGVGISSSGGCEDKKNPKCTSLDGILCGGTEVGHPSIPEDLWTHDNGWKVNVRKSACTNSYIRRFDKIKNCRDGSSQYESKAGNYYCDGRYSWDITYLGRF